MPTTLESVQEQIEQHEGELSDLEQQLSQAKEEAGRKRQPVLDAFEEYRATCEHAQLLAPKLSKHDAVVDVKGTLSDLINFKHVQEESAWELAAAAMSKGFHDSLHGLVKSFKEFADTQVQLEDPEWASQPDGYPWLGCPRFLLYDDEAGHDLLAGLDGDNPFKPIVQQTLTALQAEWKAWGREQADSGEELIRRLELQEQNGLSDQQAGSCGSIGCWAGPGWEPTSHPERSGLSRRPPLLWSRSAGRRASGWSTSSVADAIRRPGVRPMTWPGRSPI